MAISGAAPLTIGEMYAADYSQRSGLEYKSEIYDGKCQVTNGILSCKKTDQTAAPLLASSQNFYSSKIMADMQKEYDENNLQELYSDPVYWRAAAYYQGGLGGPNPMGADVDYIVGMSTFLQASVTKKCDSNGQNCKNYAVEYEYDNSMRPIKVKDYGQVTSATKTYVNKKPYSILSQNLWGVGINSEMLDFDGTFTVVDATPEDVRTANTRYMVTDSQPASNPPANIADPFSRSGLLRYYNFMGLPIQTWTTGAFNELLSYQTIDYSTGGYKINSDWTTGDPTLPIPTTVPNQKTFTYGGIKYPSSHTCFSIAGCHDWDCQQTFVDPYCIRGIPQGGSNLIPFVSTNGTARYRLYHSYLVDSTDSITYDRYGNPQFVSSSSNYLLPGDDPFSKWRSSDKIYKLAYDDTFKAYPKETSNLGSGYDINSPNPDLEIKKSATYYPFGKIKTITDENGIIQNFNYDALGRISKIWSLPDTSLLPTVQYIYTTDSTPWKIKEVKKIDSTKSVETYYIYDDFGRLIETQVKKSESAFIVSAILYDELGRKSAETKPVEATTAFGTKLGYTSLIGNPYNAPIVEYTYDALDRVTKLKDYAGNFVNTFYSPQSTQVTDPLSRIRTFNEDSQGNLINVIEPTPGP